MCMTVKVTGFRKLFNIKPKLEIAKEDIICYKIYKYKGEDKVISIHQHTFHSFELQEKVEITMNNSYNKNKWSIYRGFHSFINKQDADRCKDFNTTEIVCKCIIPKGTKYLKGQWEYNRAPNYVSETIIIEKPNLINPK